VEPGKVAVRSIDYPRLELADGPGVHPANVGRQCRHGAILRVVTTNICGSDQHMVRGRTTAPAGLVLGHEITGEVVEVGPDVEFVRVGDQCSVPFNIAGASAPCPRASKARHPRPVRDRRPRRGRRLREAGVAVDPDRLGWAKSHSFTTGQCPVMRYHHGLMNAILHDRVAIADAVNATVIPLDDAPLGYAEFDGGAAQKFVIDPHGMVPATARR
jgi:threonine dehydrogenase-like Zn-dependent dehydrogenase